MQKSVRYNEGHALYLAMLARKEGTKRGFLSKKAAEASRWHEKWFALYQNVLFYFEGEQSGRPAGMYLLEGCSCERTPAPPRTNAGPAGARDALDKQVPRTLLWLASCPRHLAVLLVRLWCWVDSGQRTAQGQMLGDPVATHVPVSEQRDSDNTIL